MNFKIIETEPRFPDILLHRDRDESGKEIVKILAIGTMENSDDMFAGEEITFESKESAQRFIVDFSSISAAKWCINQDIKY